MKLTNLTIRDLLPPDKELTFLVGAGCSIDPPSCLPAGRTMMNAIIEYTCANSEIENIKALEELRFEQLVEIIRDELDPELKIIDYYGLCDKPNIQHFFLADMIKQNNYVMTTNFDFLIENALLQLGVDKNDILPVITRNDYQNYSNPDDLSRKGKKPIYKIHGSTKNIISGENTKDYLIATIQAFGSNKEGKNVFQIEPYKRELFDNITNERSLVVLGYSGSDDFDIVPTLKVLKNLKNIIWINYSPNINIGRERIYEIDALASSEFDKLDKNLRKVTQILLEIKQRDNATHIYRLDVDTTDMVKALLKSKPKQSSKNFSIESKDWFEINVNPSGKFKQYHIPYKIYYDFDILDDSLRCSEKILQLARNSKDQSWESTALNNIGEIYRVQGSYSEAMKCFELSSRLDEEMGYMSGKAASLNNMGLVYRAQGNYQGALTRFKEALEIDEEFENLRGKIIHLNNIGAIYDTQGNYPKALKYYKKSLKTTEQLGNLRSKATLLNNIGGIYRMQGNYSESKKQYEEALKITEQLGDLSGKATHLNNIGAIYKEEENYTMALRWFKKALNLFEQLGDLASKATLLNNIGMIYEAQKKYSEALEYFMKALKITEQIGILSGKATLLNNIGMIYEAQENYLEALNQYNMALTLFEQLGDLISKATLLNNIGMIYATQKDYSKALKQYEEALQILDVLGLGESPNAKNIKENIESIEET